MSHPRALPVVTILAACGVAGPLAPASAQAPPPIVGRWDLTVEGLGRPACGWLEAQRSGNNMLVGRFVGWNGSARPVSRIDFANSVMRFAIPPQWEEGNADLRVEGTLTGEELSGTITDPAGKPFRWTGRRAPALKRGAPPQWGSPIALFDGRDLSQWQLPANDQWHVVDGVLANEKPGGNIVSKQSFMDFKLDLEFKYPKGSNSGVYLRGRYEVQIEDSPSYAVPDESMGGVYGFLAPEQNAVTGPDQWQTYDITLVGRRVTVVLNGVTVINDREIPGTTGEAMICDEGAPGPIMLQGTEGPIQYRHIVLTPAK
jgi:hypothetical protein